MSQPSHERLVRHWIDSGLKISKGCSPSDVQRFELENRVTLPEDFRLYFLNVNGMLPDAREDCDRNGFCFWPLSGVKSVVKELALHSSSIPGSAEDHVYFVFADYFQWSWAYAIRLLEVATGPNPVIHVGTLKPKVVADSFTQFVELYLLDAEQLYPV